MLRSGPSARWAQSMKRTAGKASATAKSAASSGTPPSQPSTSAGCTYRQLDDVAFAYFCDPKIREASRRNGDDPATLPRTYANTITRALEGRPAGMTIAMHTCRGNFKSAWVAEGGYEPVAEAMFSSGVDAFFMEFDTERAGCFEPLRFVPEGKKVVLGLVSPKVAQLDSRD